jgi:DNA-binding MarR family transcriptional regulator
MFMMPAAKPTLSDFLTYRIEVLNHLAKRTASEAYRRYCGVTLNDLRILRLVGDNPGINQGPLADLAYFEKTMVSKLVSSLVRRSLVQRVIGTEDARQVNLYLTADGEALRARADVIGVHMNRSLVSVLAPEERETLERCMAKLTEKAKADSGFIEGFVP